MNDFNLIPIYDKQAIIEYMPIINEGLLEVLRHTLGGEDIAVTKNDLFGQRLFLWIGELDGRYVGFITHKILLVGLDNREMYVNHCYVKNGSTSDILEKGMPILEVYAKKMGCFRITFRTLRHKPFLRRLQDFGWLEGYTELYKTLEDK